MYPTISPVPHIQDAYVAMRQRGETHRLSEMLALQAAPRALTDREFLEGKMTGRQFEGSPDFVAKFYHKRAQAAGVSTAGKVYVHQLAQEAGDPKAWVSDLGDVKRVCEERGYGCSGAFTRKVDDAIAPPARVAIDETLVVEEAARVIAKNPEIAPTAKERVELVNQIREKRKPHWAK